jgi:predicted  nucleic acid-binding Zn-ribbon protein
MIESKRCSADESVPSASAPNSEVKTGTRQAMIPDSVPLLRQATQRAATELLQSSEAQEALRKRVEDLKDELRRSKAQESKALKEAEKTKRDLEDDKANHDQHVKKVKENFNSEWKAKYHEVQKRYESEKGIFNVRELRQAINTGKRENKGH